MMTNVYPTYFENINVYHIYVYPTHFGAGPITIGGAGPINNGGVGPVYNSRGGLGSSWPGLGRQKIGLLMNDI